MSQAMRSVGAVRRSRFGAALAAALLVAVAPGCRRDGSSIFDGFGQRPRSQAATDTARPAPLPPPIALREPVRAMWVTRYHYRTPEDIAEIMQNCAGVGINTVLWQVRGRATVAYPSRLEPWSAEYGYQDPGYDPLAIAVEEAHQRGMRIEAWVNVLEAWGGAKPPPIRTHVYHTRPEWFLYDAQGRRQPLGEAQISLNPCLPEVRRHLVAVVQEIATRYAIDGVHLDYVRFVWDNPTIAKQAYPRDPRTLELFRRETGRTPDEDAGAWRAWRVNQLTRLVQEIDAMLARRRPGASLTAAVWRRPDLAIGDYFQNSVAWLRTGVVDAIMPMAYTAELAALERDIHQYRTFAPRGLIVPGLGIYKHETGRDTAAQIESCRQRGGSFALFSYDSLFPPRGAAGRSAAAAREQALRAVRRDALAGQPW